MSDALPAGGLFAEADGRTLVRSLTALRWALRLLLGAVTPAFVALLVFAIFRLAANDGRDAAETARIGAWLRAGTVVLCAPGLGLWAAGAGMARRVRLGAMWKRYLAFSQLGCLLPAAGAAVLLDRSDGSPAVAATTAFVLLPGFLAAAFPALAVLARHLEMAKLEAQAGQRLRSLLVSTIGCLAASGLAVAWRPAVALACGSLALAFLLLLHLAWMYDLVMPLRWAVAVRHGVQDAQKPGTVSADTKWYER